MNSTTRAVVVVFAGMMGFLGWLMGPATCRSGYESPSIGIQGACSHHGGVDTLPAFVRFVLSLIGAGAAAVAVSNLPEGRSRGSANRNAVAKLREEAERRAAVEALQDVQLSPSVRGTQCPSCKSTMIAVAESGNILLRCQTVDRGYVAKYRA